MRMQERERVCAHDSKQTHEQEWPEVLLFLFREMHCSNTWDEVGPGGGEGEGRGGRGRRQGDGKQMFMYYEYLK